ncbi:hypothetical protein EUTSA_v10029226mg, partial [Eutrema salsugineum]
MDPPPEPVVTSTPPPPLNDPLSSVSPSKKESYADVAQEAQSVDSGLEPVFVVANGVAEVMIPETILEDNPPLWKCFVVGYFMGEAPHVGTIHATVNRIWSSSVKTSKIDVQFLNKTTVLFRIADAQMRERVLKRKYWYIADTPLIIQNWNPESASSPPDLTALPLWVDLRGVPGYLFSQKGLSFLSRTTGRFVKLHPNTERCLRLDVARVLVEVNLQKPLIHKIAFQNNNGDHILVDVSYPWLPPRCAICQKWGHVEKSCQSGENVRILVRDDKEKAVEEQNPNHVEMEKMTETVSVQEIAQKLLNDLERTPPFKVVDSGSSSGTTVHSANLIPQEKDSKKEEWIADSY